MSVHTMSLQSIDIDNVVILESIAVSMSEWTVRFKRWSPRQCHLEWQSVAL